MPEVGKAIAETSKEISKNVSENVKNINIDKRVGEIDNNISRNSKLENISIEKRTTEQKECNVYKGVELHSKYSDRFAQTPISDGYWENGERAESNFHPIDKERIDLLKEYDVDSIPYKNAIVNFEKVSIDKVKIDNMSSYRVDNFKQADMKLAEKWNKEEHDGRKDYSAREIADYRKENNLTWHEDNDQKTCYLVDSDINERFPHLGGCSECLAKEKENG